MKKVKHIISAVAAALLAAIYLFVASAYISYLPGYTGSGHAIYRLPGSVFVRNNYTSNSPRIVLHRVFKSVAENKRRLAVPLVSVAILVFSTAFDNRMLTVGQNKPSLYFPGFGGPHPYTHLQLCMLRI